MEAVITTVLTSLIHSSVNIYWALEPVIIICLMNLILTKLNVEMQNLNIIQRNHSLCIQDADLGYDQIIFCAGDPGCQWYWVSSIYLQIICALLIMCPMTKMGFKFATLRIRRILLIESHYLLLLGVVICSFFYDPYTTWFAFSPF